MIEILTPASNTALVALETVKAHLRPAVTGTGQDEALDDLIRWASSAIATYCRRTFARQEYRETLAGSGRQILMLARFPLEDTPAVTLYDQEITDFVVEDREAGMLWRAGAWPEDLGFKGRFGGQPDPDACRRDAIVATYWAGFVLPGEQDPEDVESFHRLPDDIERAALAAVISMYRADARDPAVVATSSTSEVLKQTVSASFSAPAGVGGVHALSAEVRGLLKAYRL